MDKNPATKKIAGISDAAVKNATKARQVGTFEGPGVPALCRRSAVPCKGTGVADQLAAGSAGARPKPHSTCPRTASAAPRAATIRFRGP